MNSFQQTVIELRRLGLSCFPVLGKHPLVPWKPYQNRIPTTMELVRWAERWPLAHVGIATGAKAIVVDADSTEAIRELNHRGLPKTWASGTKRGTHFYFQSPQGMNVRNSAGEIGEHIDLRGQGGYVVWRPWLEGYTPNDIALAEVPGWLLDHLRHKEEARKPVAAADPRPFIGHISPYARRVFDIHLETLMAADNGTRNETLNVVAFRLGQWCGGGELPLEQVRRCLEAIARNWEGEDFRKSQDTILRALAEGMKSPRTVPNLLSRVS